MADCSALCVIIITLFIPPLGVFLISGCSVDLLINILLTILGYFPGHIHAFYLEYVYYHRRGLATGGTTFAKPATGVLFGADSVRWASSAAEDAVWDYTDLKIQCN